MDILSEKFKSSGLPKDFNVLMVSLDQKILEADSEVQKRMIDYGSFLKELHIIVYTKKLRVGVRKLNISNNVFVYPTNSRKKFLYVWDGYRIGKEFIAKLGLSSDSRRAFNNWLITAQDPFETGFLGYLLSRQLKSAKLELQIHTDFLSPYFFRESFKNKIRVLLGKFLIKKADRLRAVSGRIKKSIIFLFPFLALKIYVAPIFVDLESIKKSPINVNLRDKYAKYDFIILMASRLTREKNIQLALSAMLEIVKKHPKTLLLIVGDGSEKLGLELIADNYKLKTNVVFEPWSKDLASYYKTADIFLLTSNYEGYGRTIIEAMTAGLPVVMTDVGLAGELVKDGESGLIVPVNNEKDLINAILRLIQDSDLRARLSKNARQITLHKYE